MQGKIQKKDTLHPKRYQQLGSLSGNEPHSYWSVKCLPEFATNNLWLPDIRNISEILTQQKGRKKFNQFPQLDTDLSGHETCLDHLAKCLPPLVPCDVLTPRVNIKYKMSILEKMKTKAKKKNSDTPPLNLRLLLGNLSGNTENTRCIPNSSISEHLITKKSLQEITTVKMRKKLSTLPPKLSSMLSGSECCIHCSAWVPDFAKGEFWATGVNRTYEPSGNKIKVSHINNPRQICS